MFVPEFKSAELFGGMTGETVFPGFCSQMLRRASRNRSSLSARRKKVESADDDDNDHKKEQVTRLHALKRENTCIK